MTQQSLLSLAELVRARATTPASQPLLTFVGSDPEGTPVIRHYDSLWKQGQAMARALAAQGMKAGDRFALMLQNHAEYVDAMVASAILGTVFVPIDPRTRGKKLAYMLDFVECKGIIAGDYCLQQLAEVTDTLSSLEWVWILGQAPASAGLRQQTRQLSDVLSVDGPELSIAVQRLDAPMQMLFTSGTTGDPKAILGSYEHYASLSTRVPPLFTLTPQDRMYTGLSLTHANALVLSLGVSLYSGIPLVLSQKFSKSRMWSVIRDFGCTTLNLLGGMFTTLHAEPPKDTDADNPLRLIIGAGMPKQLWQPFADRFGVAILEFYGAAEGGTIINPPGVGPVGSIGKPAPHLVARIVDENDEECPPFVPGEIIMRNADGTSPKVEYFQNPEASAKKTAGGWLRMGDIGYRDDEGWFYFLHRKGNAIRRNGDFISAGFIEKEIGEHPDVTDVFVYGVPSTNGIPGEKDIVAAIVLVDSARCDAESIFRHCEQRLESNNVPSFLHMVEEIPKTASEKPLERILLQSFDPASASVISRNPPMETSPLAVSTSAQR